jgi:hypothetical protein
MLNYDYNPMTEEEAQRARFNLLPDGDYEFFVRKSTGKQSAKGNAMDELVLEIFDKEGMAHEVMDFLLWTPSMLWKMRHFCCSTNLLKEFEEKKFRPELADNKTGIARIRTQAGKEIPFDKLNGKPPGTKYYDKNVVEDYIFGELLDPLATISNNANGTHNDVPFSDDIPF